jgi:hypothetical protein
MSARPSGGLWHVYWSAISSQRRVECGHHASLQHEIEPLKGEKCPQERVLAWLRRTKQHVIDAPRRFGLLYC